MAGIVMDKVGVLGLGIIGKGVADVLRKKETDVYVWNRSPKPEPNFLGAPGEVAAICNVIQIFVTDGEALLSVMDQLKGQLTREHIVMNHSTVDPHSTIKAYEIARETGAGFLDAPFTGSRDAAATGALVYYVGGEEQVLEKARPVLEKSARDIVPVGIIGVASVIKIATNMISAATVEVLSEAYGLTRKAGIDPAVLQRAIEGNACGSALTSMKLPTIIDGDYEPHFSLKNMFKDANFAIDLGKQFGLELPVLTTTANVMYRTMQKGHAEKDYSALAINYQEESTGNG